MRPDGFLPAAVDQQAVVDWDPLRHGKLELAGRERADVTYTLERRDSKKPYVRVKRSTRKGLGPGAEKISLGTLKKGTRYRITLYAKDAAGNRSSSKSLSTTGR